MSDSILLVYYAQGDGQSFCSRCREKGVWNVSWTSFFYKIFDDDNNGIYCWNCIRDIIRERHSEAYLFKGFVKKIDIF